MNLFPEVITKALGNQSLKFKANSPKIFFVAGILGAVGSAILACRETLKLPDIVDNFKEELDEVKAKATLPGNEIVKSDAEVNRELARVYVVNTAKIVKLYAPSVIIGSASIALLTTSHVTLMRRNAAITAAYSSLSAAYESYRNRVREELGEERELAIYRNERTETVDEDGKSKKVKVVDPTKHSIYARCFDECSEAWVKNAELNRIFVQVQQTLANHRLRSRGHVFLNEVYDMLGLERSKEGAVVGWMIDNGGDNYIDFGLFEGDSARFMNGLERSIWLDFNVDGIIFDKIGRSDGRR